MSRTFTITRTLDASPEAVFRAWTDSDHLHWFFNPKTVSDIPITVDLRIGGHWRQEMIVDARTRYITGGIYREIQHDKKLVFSWGSIDGWPKLDPDHPGAGPVVAILLSASGNATVMTLTLDVPPAVGEPMAHAMNEGWSRTIDRLVAYVAESNTSSNQEVDRSHTR